jgi:hypothetical protein
MSLPDILILRERHEGQDIRNFGPSVGIMAEKIKLYD